MPDRAAPRRLDARADVVRHLQRLTTESQRIAQAFAARHGLGQIDLEALLAVMEAERAGDPLTSGRLGEALGVTSGAATGVIDRLERVGHVVRRRDDADRRRVLVHYGERAREVAGAFFGPLGGVTDTVLDGFTDDELDVVTRFLGAMSGGMAEHARSIGRPGPDGPPASDETERIAS
ncbi:MarR family winged helix-turn-helix transcriptional regulator [Frigoribacterium salinisoli]